MSRLSIGNNELLKLSILSFVAALVPGFLLGLTMHPAFYALCLPAFVLLTVRSGVELDFEQQHYRKFKSFLGSVSGEWKSYHSEHELVLLKKRGSKTQVRGAGGSRHVIVDELVTGYFYELYIMNPSHTQRLFLFSSEDHGKMQSLISKITEHSTLRLVPYNPVSARR